ncbi:MAG: hypothetical protein JWO77_3174 [Ilumatobacteraceae bacterium]|nr:hypothetical protein [Ilumatobacteraceae bacterium]
MLRHQHPARGRHEQAERGASLVEYALLLALIAVVTFSAVSFFGSSTGGGFNNSADCIQKAYDAQTLCTR